MDLKEQRPPFSLFTPPFLPPGTEACFFSEFFLEEGMRAIWGHVTRERGGGIPGGDKRGNECQSTDPPDPQLGSEAA